MNAYRVVLAMLSAFMKLSSPRVWGALFLVVSCGAPHPRVDASVIRPPEGPCDLSDVELQRATQLDVEFDRRDSIARLEKVGEDYGYEFDDGDPLGATVNDGSCQCLARGVPGSRAYSCIETLGTAYLCLGGPGSRRLWAHRNCLPFRATSAQGSISIDLSQNGCIVPDSAFLTVALKPTFVTPH